MRGYIAMLAVKKEHRGRGIATKLVRMAIDVMIERDADEVRSVPLRRRTKGTQQQSDCTRDRSHQHRGHETVRATGLSSKQTPSSLLSQW